LLHNQLKNVMGKQIRVKYSSGINSENIKGVSNLDNQTPIYGYNVFLTRKEVATMFKVHISTVDNWSSNGTLNPLGMGRKVYFRLSDVHKSITPLNL